MIVKSRHSCWRNGHVNRCVTPLFVQIMVCSFLLLPKFSAFYLPWLAFVESDSLIIAISAEWPDGTFNRTLPRRSSFWLSVRKLGEGREREGRGQRVKGELNEVCLQHNHKVSIEWISVFNCHSFGINKACCFLSSDILTNNCQYQQNIHFLAINTTAKK